MPLQQSTSPATTPAVTSLTPELSLGEQLSAKWVAPHSTVSQDFTPADDEVPLEATVSDDVSEGVSATVNSAPASELSRRVRLGGSQRRSPAASPERCNLVSSSASSLVAQEIAATPASSPKSGAVTHHQIDAQRTAPAEPPREGHLQQQPQLFHHVHASRGGDERNTASGMCSCTAS